MRGFVLASITAFIAVVFLRALIVNPLYLIPLVFVFGTMLAAAAGITGLLGLWRLLWHGGKRAKRP